MSIKSHGPGLDATLSAIRDRLSPFDSLEASIGIQGNQHYPESDGGESVAYVGAIHEYGAPSANIPARPFMRPTFDAKKGEWEKEMRTGVSAVIAGVIQAEAVLGQVGAGAAGEIRKTISTLTDPPLAPSTIKRKGFSKPLIGKYRLLLASITSEVTKK